ncbi:MAG TPA: hypothetical protein VIV11_37630 [Kofleriaceae bacterium]
MRSLLLVLLVALAGCFGALDSRASSEGDDQGSGDGSGAGGALPTECRYASDCVPAGPKCCDCPTHAVPLDDPAQRACENVACPVPSCGSPMEAACESGMCVLVCSPTVTTMDCVDGFASDANGCLVDACAMPTATECSMDNQCARVRADCCGCALGGNDTSVPVDAVSAWEQLLMCPTNPSCPMVDTCAPDLAARCVAGECTLVAGALPPNACGRPDLPACPQGEVCTVNASDPATMQGVGVCLPP